MKIALIVPSSSADLALSRASRGVLLLTAGELPPAYLRFAFLDTPLARIGGCTLVVARSERVDLVASIEQGYGDGSLTDEEYQGLMTGIDQRHPA